MYTRIRFLIIICISSIAFSDVKVLPEVQALVLAAGKSKRFNSEQSQMLAPLQSKPMVIHALQPIGLLKIPIILILGHQHELVRQAVEENKLLDIQYVLQKEQLGTGHAVLCAQPYWSKDNILITYGDMPLITTENISQLYAVHTEKKADLTLIVAANTDPACTYGRIVKMGDDIRIVEKKHFTYDISEHPLVNAGIYLVKRPVLEMCLAEIEPNSVTGEYYFTDVLEIANKKKLTIEILEVPFDAVRGVNTQFEYQSVKELMEK
jgi:bifunctional N-acetylglucosamine-1-phosphate-uridyltransferase/glucosamine-1-phosphate-acetyltransferase GlmU-like protein